MRNKIKEWMGFTTVKKQERLAAHAKTSRGMLYQIASGQRKPSAELAARIESAFAKVYSNGHPMRLNRAEISETCAKCPFAKQCLMNKDKS